MSDAWEPRIRQAAERVTNKRMGRERADETEDDEAWDEEYAQALQDELDARADDHRDRMLEYRRSR